jgi:hypothetical protein
MIHGVGLLQLQLYLPICRFTNQSKIITANQAVRKHLYENMEIEGQSGI